MRQLLHDSFSSPTLRAGSGQGNRGFVVTSRHVLIFIVVSYALVLSPLIDAGARNYLVLFAGMLSGLLFLSLRLKVTRHAFVGMLFISFVAVQALFMGGARDMGSVCLRLGYSAGYFAVAVLFERIPDKRVFLQRITR